MVDLTLDLAAPRTARRLVAALLPQWGADDQDLVDGTTLVASELVAEALVRSDDGGPVRLELLLAPSFLRVAVSEPGLVLPPQREDSAARLGIVRSLATDWGTEPVAGGGCRTWADLPLQAEVCR